MTERVKSKESVRSLIFFALALLAGFLILWYVRTLFLLTFAAILLALLLSTVSSWLSKHLSLGYRWTLSLVILCFLSAMVIFFWIASPLIAHQLSELVDKIPSAYADFKDWLYTHVDGHFKEGSLAETFIFKNEKFFAQATTLFSLTMEAVAGLLFFLFVGIYIAYDPSLYFYGFLRLFPGRAKAKAEKALLHIGHSLKWWLMGKCISMAAIGILTTLGLWLLHVPLAFILGLLAALLAFIPYIGSIIASIPAILIGFSISPWMGLYVVLLYLLIHALEGYFITPFIEQRTVFLPPALTVVVQVVLAMIVGFLGLALASPFTVVILALLQDFMPKRARKKQI